MNITPAHSVINVTHTEYLGFTGTHPGVKITELTEADFIWYSCMGDTDCIRVDLNEASKVAKASGKPLLSIIMSDENYEESLAEEFRVFCFSHSSKRPGHHLPYGNDPWTLYCDLHRSVRTLLASFQGAFYTYQPRLHLKSLESEDVFIKETDWWRSSASEKKVINAEYCELMRRSKFTLCPRGNGLSSIRLTESIYAGSIPVLLDDLTKPYGQALDFAVHASLSDDLNALMDQLRKMPDSEYFKRLHVMETFKQEFLMLDRHVGCVGTNGNTEYIRRMVEQIRSRGSHS